MPRANESTVDLALHVVGRACGRASDAMRATLANRAKRGQKSVKLRMDAKVTSATAASTAAAVASARVSAN